MKAALVSMPYQSIRCGSIQCGLLKAVLTSAGIAADVHYLNIRFARRVGLDLYEALAHQQRFLAEWSFAQAVIGRRASAVSHAERRLAALEDGQGFEAARYWRLLDEVEPFLDDCLREVDWAAYGLVGFSSVFYNQYASLALARQIKRRHPDVHIVFGGPNVEGPMGRELLRAFPWVDSVIDGEGEAALTSLVRAVEAGDGGAIAGVARRGLDGVIVASPKNPAPANLDALPAPDYDDYFQQLRVSGLQDQVDPFLFFEASRGCWWGEKQHCTFCGLNGDAMAYRSKSPERVLAEIEHLTSRHAVWSLSATDNILDLGSLDDFFPRLAQRGAEQGWTLNLFFETKSNLNRAQVSRLRASGVRSLQPGIESLSSDVLKLMRKGVSALQNAAILRACREFKLDVTWLILYGFPGEQTAHYEAIMKWLPRLTHLQPPRCVQPWTLDRFSPYFTDGDRWGVLRVGPAPDYRELYPPDVADASQLAYQFEHVLTGGPKDAEAYVAPVRDFARRWRDELAATTFLHFASGPGFAQLYDYRLRAVADRAPSFRRIALRGWQADVYLGCADPRTTGELLDAARRTADGVERRDVERALAAWASDGLILSEAGRHLSLALPIPDEPEAFLRRCQMLSLLETGPASIAARGA